MKLFKLAQLQASAGTGKIAVITQWNADVLRLCGTYFVWQCYSPVYLLGPIDWDLLSHLEVSRPTVSSGQLAEKSAKTAAASFVSHSNLEQNKKPFTLQTSYFHVQTVTFFWKVSEEFSCPLLSWARRNEKFWLWPEWFYLSFIWSMNCKELCLCLKVMKLINAIF